MSSSDELYIGMLNLRGGCRCQDPGASPPCWACSTPITTEELVTLAVDRMNHGVIKTAVLIAEAEPDEAWLTQILQAMVPSITKREFYDLQGELVERGYDANI